ncbi:hypothetical protein ECZU26_01230 [Escherichia coli]|nr:hypothetical protein ECZU26_01230 [Escherichia coli]
MGDIMRPIPFEELLTRIFDEYQQQRSIFGIPEQQFYSPVKGKTVSVFGETCATPVGPAAGPHARAKYCYFLADWRALHRTKNRPNS